MARPHVTARWLERGRTAKARVEAARPRHATVDFGLTLFERDASIGGGLLAGALAYRLFVLLLPTALLFVSGLGLYAGAADKSTSAAAKEAGLHGLIASQVASASSDGARWLIFIVMVPAVLYATATLYRALAIVHGIVWQGSGRGARATPRGIGLLFGAFLLVIAAAQIVGWIRRHDQLGGLTALLVYLVLGGGAWLLVSLQLPHRDARWQALLPGAALVGVGLLFVNVFNIYVTTRLVENRADTYGALGIATALLLSLVIVGRLMVVSAELNALLAPPERSA
ncbi:MAG TPA: YhjD/YihY/BrkB family envelope integrity protein [Gaiellaceae bacterium]|nr:YhjD/YihY/BrkB family envelope integrity protein [Gaiellaceae bacterium]